MPCFIHTSNCLLKVGDVMIVVRRNEIFGSVGGRFRRDYMIKYILCRQYPSLVSAIIELEENIEGIRQLCLRNPGKGKHRRFTSSLEQPKTTIQKVLHKKNQLLQKIKPDDNQIG